MLLDLVGGEGSVVHPDLVDDALQPERRCVVAHCSALIRADFHRLGRVSRYHASGLARARKLPIDVHEQFPVLGQHADQVDPSLRDVLLAGGQEALVAHPNRELRLPALQIQRVPVRVAAASYHDAVALIGLDPRLNRHRLLGRVQALAVADADERAARWALGLHEFGDLSTRREEMVLQRSRPLVVLRLSAETVDVLVVEHHDSARRRHASRLVVAARA